MIADNTLSAFFGYVDGVSGGEIVACQAVKDAVARFKRDYERQDAEDFPYYFDHDHAQKVIDWFPQNTRHTVGKFATERFHLQPWQEFGIANIHGWRRRSDGTRRFRRVLWQMARKNGKSTLAAACAIYAACDDVDPFTDDIEAAPQVVLAGAKKEQADRVTFSECARMIQHYPGHATKRTFYEIKVQRNDGRIFTVGSNKPYDGLNASLTILDEIHAYTEQHRAFYETMLTGGAARSQPLILCTTTAGDTASEIWASDYDYAKSILCGDVTDETWFALIYEVDKDDDPLDEASWIKSNPNLGVSVSHEFLREQANIARRSPTDLRMFTRYHGDRRVASESSAFDLEKWDACTGPLSDWAEADAVGCGVDLGGYDDLAAWALVARFVIDPGDEERKPIYRYEARYKAYIAEDTKRDLGKEPFYTFLHEMRLHLAKYPIKEIFEDIRRESASLPVYDIAYDPYNAQMIAECLEESGLVAAAMSQTTGMFNEPIRDLLQAIQDGRFRHEGCKLLRWTAKNAILSPDRSDRVMYDKRKSAEKIDPIVALTMAYRRAMVAPPKPTGELFIA